MGNERNIGYPPEVPTNCKRCSGVLIYKGEGLYKCSQCGREVLDDWGIIKNFLSDNGPASILEISYATGVDKSIIKHYLDQGDIQIADGEVYFLHCEKCGKAISGGRFCIECMQTLTGELKGAFMGNKPPREKLEISGRMRFGRPGERRYR